MPDHIPERPSNGAGPAGELDAIIVGAGFSGLYQLYSLRERLGLSVQVLEAGDGVGGTWYWNRYPGARCDSESHCYSYSFSDELQQEWNWTERYPEQPEIMRYLNHVADRFDLRRDIRFGTRVTDAHYDEAANRWHVTTEAGERLTAKFLITAVGCLSSANVPDVPGLDSFAGRWYHTGQWPQEGVDFTGQRVGLVGTGSTGIQATPVIAASAAHLTVFQRTPNFSVPARNGPLTEEFKNEVKANYGEIRRKMRMTPNGHDYFVSERLVFDSTEEERQALHEAAWAEGGLRFRSTFQDLMVDKAANDTAVEFIRAKIRQVVKDPAVADTLTAFDHPYATKRPPIDTEYFETFNRDNVTLVDVRAAPIERVTPQGIQTRDAEYPPGHHRLRHRLRRHDRPAAAHRHPRPRRRGAQGRVGRRPAHLPGATGHGLPQPVHHHRPRQPVRALQHAGGDRAARRLDHRLHRLHAGARPRPHRG